MKSLSTLIAIAALILGGCSANRATQMEKTASLQAVSKDSESADRAVKENVDFNQTEKALAIEAAIDRKVIRNADLTIEVSSTTEAQQQVTQIAETYGGFVVTSEARQRENTEPAKRTVDIKLIVRVPSNQFSSALSQIEKLATNMPQRNVTGQDVTEEFIDLEARIKTQKALELQFIEIMKQATKIADALEVQRQIAGVRTEIEKLEGRRRFLANQSSLSTIAVNLTTPAPIIVSASGIGHPIREAASDSLDLAAGLLIFFVRFVILAAPVFLLVILPLGLVALYFRRRAERIRLAAKLEANPASN
jgi:hypothetical protein